MKLSNLTYSWYVLHTKSRFENVVNEGLIKKSIEVFLPKVQVKSKRRDRKAMIRVPLFPGYLFVKSDLNPNEHLEIVKTVGGPFTGVIGTFVRYRGKGRIIVNIEALGQFAGVDVSEEDIEKLPEILS